LRQFIKRALQKIDNSNNGSNKISKEKQHDYNFIMRASQEIERLELALDSLPSGILVCDKAHNLILANKAARRLLSIISYEQGREPVWSVIPHKEAADFLYWALPNSASYEEAEFDLSINDTHRLLAMSVTPLMENRQRAGAIIRVDDITERRAKEAQIRRIENLASLTTLAAGVAHEIKNPLSSLSIHVQLIQKVLDNPKNTNPKKQNENSTSKNSTINRYLKIVNEEIERLNGIVVDFLFATRPLNAELRKANINTLIKELVEFVHFELEESGVECVLNLQENIEPVFIDTRLMNQAFLNLIKNAIAAMGDGGKLTITSECTAGELRVSIADTGAGIPEKNLAKIFEPYFTTKDSGSGLGLTLVFKIIKEHRGEITVRSHEGEGSVFFVTIPVTQSAQHLLAYNEGT
jgi:signal transduction histidine kinase